MNKNKRLKDVGCSVYFDAHSERGETRESEEWNGEM